MQHSLVKPPIGDLPRHMDIRNIYKRSLFSIPLFNVLNNRFSEYIIFEPVRSFLERTKQLNLYCGQRVLHICLSAHQLTNSSLDTTLRAGHDQGSPHQYKIIQEALNLVRTLLLQTEIYFMGPSGNSIPKTKMSNIYPSANQLSVCRTNVCHPN